MEIKDLDKQISTNSLGKLYFFCGEEQFMMENKIASMKKKLVASGAEEFDYVKLEGKKISVEEIIRALQAVPVMSDRVMIVVKNSGVFDNASAKGFSHLTEELKALPEYMCVVFTEKEFNRKKEKNLEVFKQGKGVVIFNYLTPKQLELWLEKLFENAGKRILARELAKIVERCGHSMANIYNEYCKLIGFVGEREQITEADVETVVSKSVDARIFDVIDNIAESRTVKVFEELKALSNGGENPSVIMSLLTGRMAELLMVKQLSAERLDAKKMYEYFEPKRPPFVVNKLLEQSRRFGEEYLKRMTLKGLEYTSEVREGRLDKWAAVEMYIAELIKK